MPRSSSALKPRGGPGSWWWIIVGLLLLASFGVDLDHTLDGGSIDLRNRITGARLLAAHLDPYFYKWHEPAPPEYADLYNNPLLPVSKTTATPALLALQLPFAWLPYRAGQFVWLAGQWLLLLGTAAIWLRRCLPGWPRLLFALFVTGFTYTAAWRLHAERGQSYVLLLFLFAAWLDATLTARPRAAWWAGLLAGWLATLRPPFLLLVPFLVVHRRAQLPWAAAGLALGVVLPLFGRLDAWSQYARAMETQSSFYRNGIDPAPPPERFPPAIEGIPTDLLANYADIPFADFSAHGALRRLGLEPVPAWPFLALAAGGFLVWLRLSRRGEGTQLLLGLAAWLFLADLCLPAYRNIYNDVLILNIAALGLIAGHGAVPWGVRVLFVAVPLGWSVSWFAERDDLLTDLPSLVFTTGAALLLFWFNFPGDPRKVNAPC